MDKIVCIQGDADRYHVQCAVKKYGDKVRVLKSLLEEQKACFLLEGDHGPYNEQSHKLDTREDEIKVEVATKLLALIS